MSGSFNEDFKSSLEAMVAREMLHPPLKLLDFLTEAQRSISDVTLGEVGEMPASCSLEQLHDAADVERQEFVPGFSETFRKSNTEGPKVAMQLETFRKLVDHKESGRPENPFMRTSYSFKMVWLPVAADEKEQLVDNGDLLITIRVYRPVRATHKQNTHENPMFAEEFKCLGSNRLTELRDKIACICNHQRFFDVSEDPFSAPISKETDPAFFFINDTFYNDKRNPENADYSETVRKWAKTAPGINANFKTAKMEDTRFMDLTVSMGFPQVYLHHGRCEHIFVFSQVEVITAKEECLKRERYPVKTSYSFSNVRPCLVCGTSPRSFIVTKSDRLPDDPAYLCYNCFLTFSYVDGKKVGDFHAYRMTAVGEDTEIEDYIEPPASRKASASSDGPVEFKIDWEQLEK